MNPASCREVMADSACCGPRVASSQQQLVAKSATVRWHYQSKPLLWWSLPFSFVLSCASIYIYIYTHRCLFTLCLENVPWFVGEPSAPTLSLMGFKAFPTGQRCREDLGGTTAVLHRNEQCSVVEDPVPPESVGVCCPPSDTSPNSSFLLPSSAYCVHGQAAVVSRSLCHSLHPVM